MSVFRPDNLTKDILKVVDWLVGRAEIKNSKMNATHDLDRFRLLNSVIPYVMCVVLHWLY